MVEPAHYAQYSLKEQRGRSERHNLKDGSFKSKGVACARHSESGKEKKAERGSGLDGGDDQFKVLRRGLSGRKAPEVDREFTRGGDGGFAPCGAAREPGD